MERESEHQWTEISNQWRDTWLKYIQAIFVESGLKSWARGTIYHYTSLNALLSMLNNQSLWLTDTAYMNDKQEIVYGNRVFESILRSRVDNILPLELAGRALEFYKKNQFEQDYYAMCFCKSDDVLSMWRSYGSDLPSVCIGFNAEEIIRLHPYPDFINVCYDLAEQQALAERVSVILLTRATELLDQGHGLAALYGFWSNAYQARDIISPWFKAPAFSEEREVRVVVSGCYRTRALNQFRVTDTMLVPFIAILPQYNQRIPITSVRIGPCSDPALIASGVERLLRLKGYSDAPVVWSEISFRQV